MRAKHILGRAKVGIIGLGGAGSLIAEYLGRLGVGISCWWTRTGPNSQICRGSPGASRWMHRLGSLKRHILTGSGGWPAALRNQKS